MVESQLPPVANSVSRESKLTIHIVLFLLAALILPVVKMLVAPRVIMAEDADRMVFLVLTLLAVAGFVYYARAPYKHSTPAGLLLLASLVTLAACAVQSTFPGMPFTALWSGFGIQIAVAALLLACAGSFIPVDRLEKLRDGRLTAVVLSLASCAYIPSMVQLGNSIMEPYHTSYVVNELLGPAFGSFPLVNFTSQYSNLLPYVFWLLSGGSHSVDAAVAFLQILVILTVGLNVMTVIKSSAHKAVAVFMFVAIGFSAKEAVTLDPFNIFWLYSALPVRSIVIAISGLYIASTSWTEKPTFRRIALLASIQAIGVFVNLEFGVASALAAGALVMLASRNRCLTASYILGVCVTLLVVSAALALYLGQWPRLSGLYTYARGFGDGFSAVSMPDFGLWVFVFASAVGFAVSSSVAVVKRQFCSSDAVVMYFAFVLLAGLPYYVNRSVNHGQLQFLVYILAIPYAIYSANALDFCVSRFAGTGKFVRVMAMLLPCALAIALLTRMPNPYYQWQRIFNGGKSLQTHISKMPAVVPEQLPRPIGYAGRFGNIYGAFHSGMVSVLNFNHEEDFEIHQQPLLTCTAGTPPTVVIDVAEKFQGPIQKALTECGYKKVDSAGPLIYSKSSGS